MTVWKKIEDFHRSFYTNWWRQRQAYGEFGVQSSTIKIIIFVLSELVAEIGSQCDCPIRVWNEIETVEFIWSSPTQPTNDIKLHRNKMNFLLKIRWLSIAPKKTEQWPSFSFWTFEERFVQLDPPPFSETEVTKLLTYFVVWLWYRSTRFRSKFSFLLQIDVFLSSRSSFSLRTGHDCNSRSEPREICLLLSF